MSNLAILVCVSILLSIWRLSDAQNRPWPQNVSYDFGVKPTSVSQATLTSNAWAAYVQWKNDFVTSTNASGYRRVKYQEANNWNYTASEGIGYGMLLSGYAADKLLFDDLYNYFQVKKNAQGLMFWKTDYNGNCSGGDCNSATDGDEDIAFSLLVAHCQWGSSGSINYLQQAISLINAIKTWEVDLPSGRVRPGEFFGGSHCVDPSYFLVAYYPFFKAATGDASWDAVRNWCLNYFASSAHTTTGLFRDWSQDNGGYAYNECIGREAQYAYDAARIPWRLANDYIWHGTQISRDAARKMVTWTRNSWPVSGNAANFRDCMNWDGSGNCGGNANIPIVGGMAVGAMTLDYSIGSNITWANSLYAETLTRNDTYFYNRTLGVLYQFMLSGNFWEPTCIGSIQLNISTKPTASTSKKFEDIMRIENPVSGNRIELHFNPDTEDEEIQNANLYNPQGIILPSQLQKVNSGYLLTDFRGATSGMYILHVLTNKSCYESKLMIE